MSQVYDFVVLGGGHNGLIATAFLARAGYKVACLEANEEFGGGIRSGEVTAPGYISDTGGMIHNMICKTSLIKNDELGIFSKYGFEYAKAPGLFCSIFPDQSNLIMDHSMEKTVENIAKFSQKDADVYPEFHEYITNMLNVAGIGSHSVPPAYGTMHNVMYQSPEGREFQRVLSSSAQQIVEEWFESEEVRVTFTRWCTEMMIDPRQIGTATLLYFTGYIHDPNYAPPYPKGGSNEFIKALVSACKDAGADLFNNAWADDIAVSGGEVKSVRTKDGQEFVANEAIVSTINIKHVYEMLGADAPKAEATAVRRLKQSDFGALNQSFALSKIPEFKTGNEVMNAYCIEFAPREEDYLKTFSNFKFGEFSPKLPLITIPSNFDDTRCPKGHSVVNVYSYAPYNLYGDPKNWEKYGDELKNEVWEFFKSQTTNITDDDVVGKWGLTPLEYEQWDPAFIHGDISLMGLQPSQMYDMRPIPGRGHDYHGEIENLYFIGSCAHPGPGIAGGARAGVEKILDDYGINIMDLVDKH
ncbi:MAG: NAD(P)/FAD-dependent oxidoreductase [Clostridia bacterium]